MLDAGLLDGGTSSGGRVTPHNLDAERSVLGGVLIKPSAFDEVATALRVDDFFLPAHREIFEAMLALDKRRQPHRRRSRSPTS